MNTPATPERVDPALAAGNRKSLAGYRATHFAWTAADGVATVTLNRPERKNPLTFDAYAELRDLFRALAYADDVKAVVLLGAGGNFCSGGDVFEIIEPLTKLGMTGLLQFTRLTGDLVRAMRACPQPVIAAVDGVCAGAGAIIAMASDMRLGTARSRTACRLRSKVVSRLIDTGSLSVTTGRSSRPHETSCIQAPVALPKCAISQSRSRAAMSPTVRRPSASSLASAFGPMPLTLRTGSGQMRCGTSSSDTTVSPFGFSRSEQIFASSLFGATPIEQERPVASRTASLMRWASTRVSSGWSDRSI